MGRDLRERATVVVIRDNKVLLVKDSSGQFREFMMPGGGNEDNELPIVAAASELHEETNLRASRISYLLTYESAIHRHVVFQIEAEGDVEPGPEIGDFIWWEKWLRKSEQGDKWNRCLIEGMIVLSETGARDEQTTPP